MGLFGIRSDACTFLQGFKLPFIAFFMFQFSTALGQEQLTVFQYGLHNLWGPTDFQVPGGPSENIITIDTENMTSLGDFQGGNLSWNPGEDSRDVSGKWLYRNPVQLTRSTCTTPPIMASFSTMFQVSITLESGYQSSNWDPSAVQGLAFIIVRDNSTQGEAGGYLGWLNSTTNGQASTPNNFAVELDFFKDQQFNDPSDWPHVGVDKNSLTSVNTSGVNWSGEVLKQSGALGATMWIEYDGQKKILQVFGTGSGSPRCDSNYLYPGLFCKPPVPILSTDLDLSDTISQEPMFVGFSGSISNSLNRTFGIYYTIDGWTFNSDGPTPDVLRTSDGSWADPALEAAKRRRTSINVILAATIPSVMVFLILVFIIWLLYRRNIRLTAIAKKYEVDLSILDQGPQNFKYRELSAATQKFSPSELLGSGGFGSVYKGRLALKGDKKKTKTVAIKRISATSDQGAQEFSAEVKIIGQAQHRNLVRLLGWCHEGNELLLVYDYMSNGSLDHHLFRDADHEPGESVLTWSRRLKIVSGVAAALKYLHEEWEYRVIHRDVKSSNVMLDDRFNARLGDFGLARMSEHNEIPESSAVLAGTRGYLAPEYVLTMKANDKTDVYSFGAMVLEVATGKRPLRWVEDKGTNELLVDKVWGLYGEDALLEAADCRLQNAYDDGEMLTFLKIGLLCSHPNPDQRPTMREVLDIWTGLRPLPALPRLKPVPIYRLSINESGFDCDDADTNVMISTDSSSQSDLSRDQIRRWVSGGQIAKPMPSIDESVSLQPEKLVRENDVRTHSPSLRNRQSSFRQSSLPF